MPIIHETPRLVFAGLCRKAEKVGMAYNLEGLTHHLVTNAYPYVLDHGVVTCWELGEAPFIERMELTVEVQPGMFQTTAGERQVMAKNPRLTLETNFHFQPPSTIPIIFEQNCRVVFRLYKDGEPCYQSLLTVLKVAPQPT